MKINEILDVMENLLLTASRVPFTNRRIIEEDDLLRLIDELHDSLPASIMEAERIIAERQRIVEDAQKSAQEIVAQARGYVSKLTEENTITRQAQENATEIIAQARQSAETLNRDAVQYASDVFQHLENHLERTLEVVRQGHQELYPNKSDKV